MVEEYSLSVLILMVVPFCVCSWIIFAHDIFGTIHERLARYPKSHLIWSGSGAYGSSDYGTKIYYHWTPDTIDIVEGYYSRVILETKPTLMDMEEFNANELWVCLWVGFARSDGCETMKTLSEIKNGTLITFQHEYFAG